MDGLQKDKEGIIAELRDYNEVIVYENCDASIDYVSNENRLSRKQALSDYTRYANNSEGSEHERMMTVVEGIKSGLTVIFDDVDMQMAYDKAHPENDGGKTKRVLEARENFECRSAKYWISIAELCNGVEKENLTLKAQGLETIFQKNKELYPMLSGHKNFESLTMDFGFSEEVLTNIEKTAQGYENGDVDVKNGELVINTPAYKGTASDDISHDVTIIEWYKGNADFNALLTELREDKPQTFTKSDVAIESNKQKGNGKDK